MQNRDSDLAHLVQPGGHEGGRLVGSLERRQVAGPGQTDVAGLRHSRRGAPRTAGQGMTRDPVESQPVPSRPVRPSKNRRSWHSRCRRAGGTLSGPTRRRHDRSVRRRPSAVGPVCLAGGPTSSPRADTCSPRADTCSPRADTCSPRADTCSPRADRCSPPRDPGWGARYGTRGGVRHETIPS